MSTAHDHDLGPTGADAVEPDVTPDAFLFKLGIGLTVLTVFLTVLGAILFYATLESEKQAKGYFHPAPLEESIR